MNFELFDRDVVAAPVDVGPAVRVAEAGRVLFSRGAWAFLAMQGTVREVTLSFDAETRTVAVRPATPVDAAGARWPVMSMRSLGWPCGINAGMFVDHFQVLHGARLVRLLRGPGPRMVTFTADGPLVDHRLGGSVEVPAESGRHLQGLP